MDPLVGKTIDDRYTLHRLVGKGAMGRVYLATDQRLHGRECAIKILQAHDDEDERGRFERELRIVSLLRSPYVVQVLDSGVMRDGRPYIVMEFLVGSSLHHVIKRKGALDPPDAVGVAIDILQGLAEAHVYGIVHRDLKPANIFLCPTNDDGIKATVLDFGVAKQLRGDDADITKTRASVGTPRYMAPEQFIAGELSPRTDLYGVGVLLYIMLTGQPPFSGHEEVPEAIAGLPLSARLAWLHLHRVPPRVDGVSDELADLVAEMLAKRLADRPPAARAVIERLRRVPEAIEGHRLPDLSGAPDFSAPPSDSDPAHRATASISPPPVRRRRWVPAVLLALAALAGGVGAWLAVRSKAPAPVADEGEVKVRVGTRPAVAPDAAAPDAAPPDAALPDAALPDATLDAAPPDAAVDAAVPDAARKLPRRTRRTRRRTPRPPVERVTPKETPAPKEAPADPPAEKERKKLIF